MIRHLQLILGASLLEGVRWVREHLYAVCVLGPLVLGMTYLGVGRALGEAEWSPTAAEGAALRALTRSRLPPATASIPSGDF